MRNFNVLTFIMLPNGQPLKKRMLSVEIMINIPFNLIFYSYYLSPKRFPVEIGTWLEAAELCVLSFCQFLPVYTGKWQKLVSAGKNANLALWLYFTRSSCEGHVLFKSHKQCRVLKSRWMIEPMIFFHVHYVLIFVWPIYDWGLTYKWLKAVSLSS